MHVPAFSFLALAASILASPVNGQAGAQSPARSFLGAKPARTVTAPDNDPQRLEVKFVHGAGVRLRGGHFQAALPGVSDVDTYLEAIGARRQRVYSQSDEWLEDWRATGEARSGKRLHDLTQFYRVELSQEGTVAEVCDALNAFPAVALAYPLPRVGDPVAPVRIVGPGTPDYEGMQGYRGPAPTGVDADYGNTFGGGIGTGTTIADVETGWTDDHEDIAHKALGNFVGLSPAPYPWDHGTAVIGELVGEDNALGVRGICHDASILLSSHLGSSANIPTAIANGAAAVGAGDALVLEVQCFGGPPGPFPCEYVASTYATVETATANGVHVFAAAGNGDNNLDQVAYGGLFDRNVRDSGAVMVGASDGSSLNKASFSNYGSRLDAHGWGFNVTTSGYGDLFNPGTVLREYTAQFSGTSSATPIVTGAGVVLNGIHRAVTGNDLTPLALRELINTTGTPQGTGGQIGPRPDIRAAIEELRLPRVRPTYRRGPLGSIILSVAGDPGDEATVLFSAQLREVPLVVPGQGRFFLGSRFLRVSSGTFGANGELEARLSVPPEAAAFGGALGYVQAWIRSADGRRSGLTNYVVVEVP